MALLFPFEVGKGVGSMRNVVFLLAGTLGSVAFQMSVDAGYVRDYAWAVPWVWALCVALWALWLVTHDKVRNQWLRSFHDRAGRWVIALRIALFVMVFFCVGSLPGWILKKPVASTIPKAAPQQEPQQSKPEGKNGDKKDSKKQVTKPKPKAEKPSPDISVGSISQGPCGNVQVGGSNNTATTNCVSPSRVLTAEKAKQLTRDFAQIPHLNTSIFPAGISDDVQPVFLQLCNIIMDSSWHPNCQGLNGTSIGGIKIPVIEGMQCFSSSWNTGAQALVKSALDNAGFGCNYIDHRFTANGITPGEIVILIGTRSP